MQKAGDKVALFERGSSRMGRLVVFLQRLLILGSFALITKVEGSTKFSLPPNCTKSCGDISIEYPFGIENGCFHPGFNLSCANDQTTNFTPTLLLGDGTTKIKQIDMEQGIVYIKSPIITMDVDKQYINNTMMIDLKNLPYSFNLHLEGSSGYYYTTFTSNAIYFVGCSAIANLVDLKANNTYIWPCVTMCSSNDPTQQDFNSFAYGHCRVGLYQVNTTSFGIQLVRLKEKDLNLVNTSSIKAFILDIDATDEDMQELITKENITATLRWYINDGYPTCDEAKKNNSAYVCGSNTDCYNTFYDDNFYKNSTSVGYICRCFSGYRGNPYLSDGCQASNFSSSPKKECAKNCGGIDIPFPFGLEKDCYMHEFFSLKCNETTKPPTLVSDYLNVKVNNIALEDGQLEFERRQDDYSIDNTNIYRFARVKLSYNWVIAFQNCETAKTIDITTFACIDKHSECINVNETSNGEKISGYRCKCSKGYQGNPYLDGGCASTKVSLPLFGIIAGISSGVGFLILCAIIFILRKKFRERRNEKMRKRYFHQNHGLLLKQLISSGEDIVDRTKIFSLKEVEKATNNFDKTRVLGRGGHGTVYKGILSDQRVVAIKKSKIVQKSEIDQFINEVAILSQINHRHVVRLFGCCLETEVPLLIYEFISNGALSDHLHVADGNSILSWEDRLRIATEAAGALAYLHSAASISILHRDVKSPNILLDDHLAAKVSDFGASRFIPLDQTHIITTIQGTFGYLDPEYYQTSQLTQKSDVYSFGVILLELLTGKKPVYTTKDGQDLNLSIHFLQAVRVNRPFDLMDDRVMKESNEEELDEIVQLVQMCLRLKGVDRPTMKEVEYKLQSLRKIRTKKKGHCTLGVEEETEHLLNATSYASSDGASRNYSMENEVMWSQHHPR